MTAYQAIDEQGPHFEFRPKQPLNFHILYQIEKKQGCHELAASGTFSIDLINLRCGVDWPTPISVTPLFDRWQIDRQY